MKRKTITVLSFFLLSATIIKEKSHYKHKSSSENNAFRIGEKLTYRVSYGIIDAGEVTLEVKKSNKEIRGNRVYHVVGKGRTLGGFNAIFKVDDTYESYIDMKKVHPLYFKRRVDEGGYKIKQDYNFLQTQNKVKTQTNSFNTPEEIQDMISSFYYARTLDFSNIKKNKTFEFNCFMDEEVYPLKIKYIGDEKIKIRKGTFHCHKFVPVLQTGRYFNHEEDVEFWVTNDDNHIPVLVKAKIPVGTIKMHLVDWKGLKNPLKSKK